MSLGSRFQGNKSSLLKIDSHYLHLCVGAIVGALVGDCLGSYWEIGSWVGTHPIQKVKKKIEEKVRQTQSGKAPVISYTDDTAMTLAMAKSIVSCKGFDSVDMARK